MPRARGARLDIHFEESDDWSAADMQRHLRYLYGSLSFYADYVRGRMMKTSVTVRPDGRFTIETTNRGEAATRWVPRLQGKKLLSDVPTQES